ncbi:3'-5' exonuclease domain-containing protein 2 [Belliella sp. DSM 107340]|uniref:3'-5' exonuclease domain-containing protein 2 n=1 Tax=Belliella calami TaxID=2923436 RepID=A0ABS9UR19_9BACT|nr:3'-5' exonuclease [Belliella calami]MCH7399067.1 3'-5' exonuclease domain-containing protein 2 [Belliella calami]
MIPKSITKEQVNELPLGQFEGEIILINSMDQVQEAVDELSSHSLIGFDTETKPAFKKGVFNQVSLLQLSTPEVAYLIRLNELGLPEGIREILEDRQIVKIGAAVLDDLRGLRKYAQDFVPASFFDLNQELKKVGFLNIGVRNLAAMVMEIRISKSEQVSNWEAVTLSEKQMLYAATDAWVCLEIYKKLYAQGYLDDLFRY